MAKQQPSAEPKAPLIVALAFFVLASLVLGVLFYLETDKKASAVAEAKKAADDKSNANKLLSEEQDKVRMYRTVVGISRPFMKTLLVMHWSLHDASLTSLHGHRLIIGASSVRTAVIARFTCSIRHGRSGLERSKGLLGKSDATRLSPA